VTGRYRRLVRTTTVALAALVALVAVSGAAARDPREPQQHHTAVDTRTAKSIGLLLSDFASGWKTAPKPKQEPPCSVSPDESKLVQTARIDPTFLWKDDVTQVGSEVDVFKTKAHALRDWRVSTLKVMQACLFEGLRRDIKGAKIRLHSSKRLAPIKLGERNLHYRLVFDIVGQGKTLPVVTEMIGLGVGRISVVLHAVSIGSPLPAAALHSLGSVLAKRLVAAAGGI
jgi:hypothetical protein